MITISDVKNELEKYIDKEKAEYLPKFFKTYPGGYGEGDIFIGVTVPNQRKVARKYKNIPLNEVERLLNEDTHEYRLTALLILVIKYEKGEEDVKNEVVDLYFKNLDKVNNWDLVDSSSYKILGPHLINRDKKLLYDLANTNDLWRQRIAIISTFYFIKNNKFAETLKLSKILLNHKHDLIHKAVGWMLREIGNRNKEVEVKFLKEHYKEMPRTMLRYAIEKFENNERKKFLKGEV